MTDYEVILSASLIVKNEEDFLPACLASLAGHVDEIVVLDTGSTDRTKEIAREFGARVIEGEWRDDFSAARNESLDACRGEWVLIIDADETLEVGVEDLRAAVDWVAGDVTSFAIQVINAHDGFVRRFPRLFRRERCGRWTGRIFETLTNARVRESQEWDEVILRHHGDAPDVIAERKKAERNLRIARAAAAADDADIRPGVTLCKLALTLLEAKDFAGALQLADEALQVVSLDYDVRQAAKTAGLCSLWLGWQRYADGDRRACLDHAARTLTYAAQLREASEMPSIADWLAGVAHRQQGLSRGDPQRLNLARVQLARVHELTDEDGEWGADDLLVDLAVPPVRVDPPTNGPAPAERQPPRRDRRAAEVAAARAARRDRRQGAASRR